MAAKATASSTQSHMTESGFSFRGNIHDEFNCIICHFLLNDPYQCKKGHLYCKNCIDQWRQKKNACPVCDCTLSDESLSRSIAFSAIIAKQQVTCNEPSGAGAGGADVCTWSGSLEKFERHCNKDCMHVTVSCANTGNGCSTRLWRKHMMAHERTCPDGIIPCDLCSTPIKRGAIDNHKATVCPKMAVDCTQGCGCAILRKDVEAHIDLECPETVVGCPFAAMGCAVRNLRRKDTANHLQSRVADHVSLIPSVISSLKEVAQGDSPLRKSIKWETRLPSSRDPLLSSFVKLGDYLVQLRLRQCGDHHLSVYVWIESRQGVRDDNLFPVNIGGTKITIADTSSIFSCDQQIIRHNSGRNLVKFITLEKAQSATNVDGKITICAAIVLYNTNEASWEPVEEVSTITPETYDDHKNA